MYPQNRIVVLIVGAVAKGQFMSGNYQTGGSFLGLSVLISCVGMKKCFFGDGIGATVEPGIVSQ